MLPELVERALFRSFRLLRVHGRFTERLDTLLGFLGNLGSHLDAGVNESMFSQRRARLNFELLCGIRRWTSAHLVQFNPSLRLVVSIDLLGLVQTRQQHSGLDAQLLPECLTVRVTSTILREPLIVLLPPLKVADGDLFALTSGHMISQKG